MLAQTFGCSLLSAGCMRKVKLIKNVFLFCPFMLMGKLRTWIADKLMHKMYVIAQTGWGKGLPHSSVLVLPQLKLQCAGLGSIILGDMKILESLPKNPDLPEFKGRSNTTLRHSVWFWVIHGGTRGWTQWSPWVPSSLGDSVNTEICFHPLRYNVQFY